MAENSPPPLIEWDDSLLVGETTIDEQHKLLAEQLNRLHASLVHHAQLEEVVALLKAVLQHIEIHFAYEERLMTSIGYKNMNSHLALHAHLLEDLRSVIRDVASRRYEELEEMLENYLKFWLLDHIQHVDKPLGLELKKSMA
ncbi:putative hemerythrin-like, metal-binding (MHR) protein (Bacteriohemerythrin) [Rhodospirillaceae bacterium LM-1]|nr:putative hemerythrin-like, metal-binding (MHR) protein (Bacteriohemerythrin) [Rhodospirillaceae bacterium LM-1]